MECDAIVKKTMLHLRQNQKIKTNEVYFIVIS